VDFKTGYEAYALEQRIHEHLRNAGHQVDEGVAKEACGYMNGYTEVFWLAGVLEAFAQDDLLDWAA
jgi:hypothetical protein